MQCFSFLKGVGKVLEEKLKGYDWERFLESEIDGISKERKYLLDLEIRKAKRALFEGNVKYFKDNFPSSELWRLYDFFRDEVVFLDIEVSGVSDGDDVILIGVSDGYDVKIMIKDVNLDFDYLSNYLNKFKLIVTFNGSVFDIPFIKKRYDNLIPEIPCIDLRFLCEKTGLRGGLKEIEKELGIKRRDVIEKFNSGDPYTLFRMFKGSGDEYYLKLLAEYNEEDVVNLKVIMEYCLRRLKKKNCIVSLDLTQNK